MGGRVNLYSGVVESFKIGFSLGLIMPCNKCCQQKSGEDHHETSIDNSLQYFVAADTPVKDKYKYPNHRDESVKADTCVAR